ncbi:MAG: Bacteriophage Mu Gam like protein [Candidatus Nomurabacteria bacterium]|nr:Bacteriophage Mu Gam like protein [Candidatus Nomurabacteria bacterium]
MDTQVVGTVVKRVRPPKALWEVAGLLKQLASNIFAHMRIENSYKQKITDLQKERDEKLAAKKKVRDEIVGKIFDFVRVRREEFGDKKSVVFAAGEVGFRKVKAEVEIAEGFTEKGMIAKFLKRKKKYLRFTPSLNRQVILQDYQDGKFKSIKGISIRGSKGEEEFFISPSPRNSQVPKVITMPVNKC